jgi:prepilin-type N-terminal cleavage/methylation domain-containing protein
MTPISSDARCGTRGFTLLELLITLVIFVLVAGMFYGSIQLTQRTSRAQTERSMLQGNVRAAVRILSAELQEIAVNPTGGTTDIVAMDDSSITYRSMRASGVTCNVGASQVVFRASNGLLSSSRNVTPGRDSLLLFVDGDSLTTSDDAWVGLQITATPSAATCPDGTTGLRVQTSAVPGTGVLVPGPARTFEVMQLATLRSGGLNYIGARSVSAGQSLTPFIGPIDSTTGVRFRYYDASGATTASRTSVRQIDIMVRGATRTPINEGVGPGPGVIRSDSLRVQVSVRNSS